MNKSKKLNIAFIFYKSLIQYRKNFVKIFSIKTNLQIYLKKKYFDIFSTLIFKRFLFLAFSGNIFGAFWKALHQNLKNAQKRKQASIWKPCILLLKIRNSAIIFRRFAGKPLQSASKDPRQIICGIIHTKNFPTARY